VSTLATATHQGARHEEGTEDFEAEVGASDDALRAIHHLATALETSAAPCDHSRVRRLFISAVLACGCVPAAPVGTYSLKIAVAEPLGHVEPADPEGGLAFVTDLVYQGLVEGDNGGHLRPRVATSFARREDGHWLLVLDPGARFSDGSPVTARDAIWSLAAGGLESAATAGGIDVWCSDGPAMAAAMLPMVSVFKESGGNYLGTAAFRVAEESPARVKLVRVAPAPGRIAEVEFLGQMSDREGVARALRGEVGAVLVQQSYVDLLRGAPQLQLVRSPSPAGPTVLLKASMARAVRRALAGRIRAAGIARVAYGEGGCAEIGQEPEAAPELPPGRSIDVWSMAHDEGMLRAARAVRRALGSRGRDVHAVTPDELLHHLAAGDVEVALVSYVSRPPALERVHWRTGAAFNLNGYSNPLADAAIDRGDDAALAKILDDDPQAIVLCYPDRILAVDSRIRNPTPGRFGTFDTVADWEVGP
jgi:hypothetical protein